MHPKKNVINAKCDSCSDDDNTMITEYSFNCHHDQNNHHICQLLPHGYKILLKYPAIICKVYLLITLP